MASTFTLTLTETPDEADSQPNGAQLLFRAKRTKSASNRGRPLGSNSSNGAAPAMASFMPVDELDLSQSSHKRVRNNGHSEDSGAKRTKVAGGTSAHADSSATSPTVAAAPSFVYASSSRESKADGKDSKDLDMTPNEDGDAAMPASQAPFKLFAFPASASAASGVDSLTFSAPFSSHADVGSGSASAATNAAPSNRDGESQSPQPGEVGISDRTVTVVNASDIAAHPAPTDVHKLLVRMNDVSLLPPELTRLSSLRELQIERNRFTVFSRSPSAPASSSSSSSSSAAAAQSAGAGDMLSSLTSLEIKRDPSDEVDEWAKLPTLAPALRSLSLHNVTVDGLPFSLLTQLERLEICGARLQQLPGDVTKLRHLSHLRLSNNRLASVPDEIGQLSRLQHLDLSMNELASLPESLGELSGLQSLDVRFNRLSLHSPKPSSTQKALSRLRAKGCEVLGDADEEMLAAAPELNSSASASSSSAGAGAANSSALSLPMSPGAPATLTPKTSLSSSSSSSPGRASNKLLEDFNSVAHDDAMFDASPFPPSLELPSLSASPAAQPRHHANSKPGPGSFALPASSSSASSCSAMKRKKAALDDFDEDEAADHTRKRVESTPSSSGAGGSPANASNAPFKLEGMSDLEPSSKPSPMLLSSPGSDSVSSASPGAANGTEPSERGKLKRKTTASQASRAERGHDSSSQHPAKRRKQDPASLLTSKYLSGYLDFDDIIVDGFYDAGRAGKRDESLGSLRAAPPNLNEREVLVVDAAADERLQMLKRSAIEMLANAKDDDVRVRFLAIFVSDSMGGRQDSFAAQVHAHEAQQKAAAQQQQHVAAQMQMQLMMMHPLARAMIPPSALAAAAAAAGGDSAAPQNGLGLLVEQCRNEVRHWKQTSNSNVLPVGVLTHGLCRHRAILMKYLCDHMQPRIPCALVRGYREHGIPHAWNVVKIRGKQYIIDTLDAPHFLRDVKPHEDDSKWQYYPQYALSTFEHPGHLHDAVVGKEIGQGTYSRVFECDISAYVCAVKVAPTAHLQRPQFAMLLRELRVLPWLNHPNIVQFLGYLITSSEMKIFMERVHGPSLMQLVQERRKQQRPFSLSDVLLLAREIASGLQYLHEQNIIHRDLKSGNILIGDKLATHDRTLNASFAKLDSSSASASDDLEDEQTDSESPSPPSSSSADSKSERSASAGSVNTREFVSGKRTRASKPRSGSSSSSAAASAHPSAGRVDLSRLQVKICDFNVAVPLGASAEKKLEYAGTIRWCAPEVLHARFTSDARHHQGKESDIWSFGMILLELLTLQLPYEGYTEERLVAALQKGQRPELAPSSLRVVDNAPPASKSKQSLIVIPGATSVASSPSSSNSSSSSSSAVASAALSSAATTANLSLPASLAGLVELMQLCTVPQAADRPTARAIASYLSQSYAAQFSPDASAAASGRSSAVKAGKSTPSAEPMSLEVLPQTSPVARAPSKEAKNATPSPSLLPIAASASAPSSIAVNASTKLSPQQATSKRVL